MGNYIKRIFMVMGLITAAIIAYYAVVIIKARMETPEMVSEALKSGKMALELSDFYEEQLNVLLKVQDPNFYRHQGYDFTTPGTGMTTISQGLVKMYYFDDFKPGVQKIEQTLIARFAFDALTPKDTILKLFINEVYLGHHGTPIHGFEQAANAYYHKGFSTLNWDEYLSIVAMIRAPETFHCIRQPKANKQRVERIKRMLEGEYIPVNNGDLLYDKREID